MHCEKQKFKKYKGIILIKVMEKINVFIVTLPSFGDVVEKIKGKIEDKFEKPLFNRPKFDFDEEDFTPRNLRVNEPCGNVQPWGIRGKKADENLRFGAAFEIDEPMYQHYDDEDDFLEAREAFDDFVDAGERCVELGLDKKSDAPITKCNAIRKPIGCPPPMNQDLLGESQFPWWEMDLEWDF